MTRPLCLMLAASALAALTITGLIILANAPDPFEYKDALHDIS